MGWKRERMADVYIQTLFVTQTERKREISEELVGRDRDTERRKD